MTGVLAERRVVHVARELVTGRGCLTAVVDGDPVLMVGWDRQGTANPRQAATAFPMASAAKAVTALVVACLVDEGLLDWDEPLRNVLPGLRLQDPAATQALSIRDVLCHRSGLPRHDGVLFGARGLTRSDLLEMLPHLAPSCGFRSRFQYSNLMYALAGHACERLTGTSWADLVAARVLTPLGMTAAVVDGGDVAAPAGSVTTTAPDLVAWLRTNLEPRAPLAELALPLHRREIEVEPAGLLPETTTGYGRGWFTGTYRQHRFVHHGGAIPGASSLVALLPDRGIGVAVLLEGSNPGACEALAYAVLDDVLGLPPEPRDQRAHEASPPLSQSEQESFAELVAGDRAGRYVHPAYGEVQVHGTTITWRQFELPLVTRADGTAGVVGPDGQVWPVGFGDGHVLQLPLEPALSPIVFRRVPSSPCRGQAAAP